MGAATDGALFPVILFDCGHETEMGNVFIDASLSFKDFQSLLSRRIGVSPHQISIYLVDRNRCRESPRRIPITSKVDFATFLPEKDCVFFAVLKRKSRRLRRRRGQKDSAGYGIGVDRSEKIPPPNVTLLRRNAEVDGDRPFSVLLPLVEYENRVRRLEMEREKYLLDMGFSDLRLDREDTANGWAAGDGRSVIGGLVVCEECSRAEKMGRDRGFHWCVYDTVTVGFRSPAGPISRPGKMSR